MLHLTVCGFLKLLLMGVLLICPFFGKLYYFSRNWTCVSLKAVITLSNSSMSESIDTSIILCGRGFVGQRVHLIRMEI